MCSEQWVVNRCFSFLECLLTFMHNLGSQLLVFDGLKEIEVFSWTVIFSGYVRVDECSRQKNDSVQCCKETKGLIPPVSLNCFSDLTIGIFRLHAPSALIDNQNCLEEFEYCNALVDMGSVRT
jgi:hypothetical protein